MATQASASGKYGVILADPAWDHARKPPNRNAARFYDGTMSIEAITALPVRALAARDCALFLWVTMVHLHEAKAIMQAWGFRPATTAFTWVKLNADGTPFKGMGAYTRANPELCLLGIRGRPRVKAHDVSSVILARRREHSRKPDEQYERIERLFDGPYLEMFARQQWPGWDVWGNQTAKFPAQPPLLPEVAAPVRLRIRA